MKRFFLYSVLIISFFSIFYSNLKDIIYFPKSEAPYYDFLKKYAFGGDIGFCSDYVNSNYILYRLQYSLMPLFVKNSPDAQYVFCYSNSSFCFDMVKNGYFQIENIYTKELVLLKNKIFTAGGGNFK